MATFQAVYVPASPTTATLLTGTIGAAGTAAVPLSTNTIFAVTANGNCNIRFGNATRVPTATAADFPVWAGTVQEWATGSEFDRVSLFSSPGATYWIYVLSATK